MLLMSIGCFLLQIQQKQTVSVISVKKLNLLTPYTKFSINCNQAARFKELRQFQIWKF